MPPDNVPFDCRCIYNVLSTTRWTLCCCYKATNGKYRTYNNPNDEFLSAACGQDGKSKGMLIYGINKYQIPI